MAIAIHLFSGLGSSLLLGLQRGTRAIEHYIDRLGHADAEHHIWNQWPAVADKIIKQRPAKVVLIGHSNGVIATNEIARRLRLAGIRVNLIAALDPTAAKFPAIGSNVSEVVEFWAASGWPALTRRWTRNRNGALHFDGFHGIHRLYHMPGGHVPLASRQDVRDLVVKAVAEAVK
jgi:thioesterase domain-containing protein